MLLDSAVGQVRVPLQGRRCIAFGLQSNRNTTKGDVLSKTEWYALRNAYLHILIYQ